MRYPPELSLPQLTLETLLFLRSPWEANLCGFPILKIKVLLLNCNILKLEQTTSFGWRFRFSTPSFPQNSNPVSKEEPREGDDVHSGSEHVKTLQRVGQSVTCYYHDLYRRFNTYRNIRT